MLHGATICLFIYYKAAAPKEHEIQSADLGKGSTMLSLLVSI